LQEGSSAHQARVSVVIPAKNEEKSLPTCCWGCPRQR